MIEIILDASQLETFEPCPRKWFYAYQLSLIPKQARRAFDIGSYYHEVLAHFYSLKNLSFNDKLKSAIDFSAQEALLSQFRIKDIDERKFHRKRLIEYFIKYRSEDEVIKVIAIEQGFTYLLYEDAQRRYILEGKIDFVGEGSPYGLFVMDHKTQARKDDRWEFNHQVCNYLTFTKADYFVYNYIGLQDKLPSDGMRRMIYKPHPGMLEQWKSEVINTFRTMEQYIGLFNNDTGRKFEENFPRRRSACDSSKYGLCQYHKLCSVPDNSKWVEVVKSAFKPKEEKWQAWK